MHHLVLGIGRDHAGLRGLRAILEAHEHHYLGAERFLIERDRLLAAAIEEQIGLDVHSISLSVVGEPWAVPCNLSGTAPTLLY